MKADTYIISSWQQEIKKHKQQVKESKQARYAALKDFKDSICDMFDMADFYYYAETIGCHVSYLLNLAKYSTDQQYIKYYKSARDLKFRRWFYINNGHSITKQNPLFQ